MHEVGRHLLVNAKTYQCRQAELEGFANKADYSFFGLSPEATDKDVDNAYRRLAKQMHPDKNGGTEEAKRRFQGMKQRYEGLKARRAAAVDGGKRAPAPPPEDGEAPPTSAKGRIEYDPHDRQSLHETVWRMLSQLRTLGAGLDDLARQLRSAGAHRAAPAQ